LMDKIKKDPKLLNVFKRLKDRWEEFGFLKYYSYIYV
jgi:hypothetical protein